jgi:hypothetical protein
LRNSPNGSSQAGKALPALVLGLVASVGSVDKHRLALPHLLLRAQPGESDATLQRRLVHQAATRLTAKEALVVDAGFALSDLLACPGLRFVARTAKNFTARKNQVPLYKGKGRPPVYGDKVRPLARFRAGKETVATKPDVVTRWTDGRHTLRAHLFENLVPSDQTPGTLWFRCLVIFDPRYPEPLVLVTNLPVSAYALWRLYRDRWPIEQLSQAAKQMLGCERAFVFGQESRWRLPELALLAGNLLSYVAATSQPVATGFGIGAPVRPVDVCAVPCRGNISPSCPLRRGNFAKRRV